MITCIPFAFFSWKFEVEGAAEPAALAFNFFGESGSIDYGPDRYEVNKQGIFSGVWNLELNGRTHARAKKSMLRRFEVLEDNNSFELNAQLMSRCYDILQNGAQIGSIRPMNIFTRKSVIDCDSAMSEQTQLFCFWLAALTWRRAAHNNSSGPT